jgi:ribosomal protein L11 methyltransferase
MKWLEIKVTIESVHSQAAIELISQVFHDEGVQGVIIEDPDLMPLESWGKDALRATQHAVIGYMPQDDQAEKRSQALTAQIKKAARIQRDKIHIRSRLMDEEDWSHSWKDFFWPERITDQIVVKPTWRDYRPQKDDIIIEIDPGMAFGTGTHPTTAMCLQLIEKNVRRGHSFLDIGTGSGILMIAAAKLGAKPVRGIDSDAMAVTIAEQNLRLNGIDNRHAHVTLGNLTQGIQHPFEVVVANILSEVIMDLLDELIPVMTPRGVLVCSGIVTKDKASVVNRMQQCQFRILEITTRDEWVAITARRPA